MYIVILHNGMSLAFDDDYDWLIIDGDGEEIPTTFLSKKELRSIKDESRRGDSVVKLERTHRGIRVELDSGKEFRVELY